MCNIYSTGNWSMLTSPMIQKEPTDVSIINHVVKKWPAGYSTRIVAVLFANKSVSGNCANSICPLVVTVPVQYIP